MWLTLRSEVYNLFIQAQAPAGTSRRGTGGQLQFFWVFWGDISLQCDSRHSLPQTVSPVDWCSLTVLNFLQQCEAILTMGTCITTVLWCLISFSPADFQGGGVFLGSWSKIRHVLSCMAAWLAWIFANIWIWVIHLTTMNLIFSVRQQCCDICHFYQTVLFKSQRVPHQSFPRLVYLLPPHLGSKLVELSVYLYVNKWA